MASGIIFTLALFMPKTPEALLGGFGRGTGAAAIRDSLPHARAKKPWLMGELRAFRRGAGIGSDAGRSCDAKNRFMAHPSPPRATRPFIKKKPRSELRGKAWDREMRTILRAERERGKPLPMGQRALHDGPYRVANMGRRARRNGSKIFAAGLETLPHPGASLCRKHPRGRPETPWGQCAITWF